MSAPTDRPDDPNLGARGEWLARVSEAASGLAASQTPEQPRGNSNGSTITVSYTSLPPSRHKSLDPTFLFAPPSQLRSRSKLAVCGGLIAIISSAVITAALGIGQFQPADIWHQLGILPTTELASSLSRPAQLNPEQAIPRLIVQSSRVSSGEPAPLGVALRGRAEGAVVIIKGLVPGMELSAGNAVGTDAWQLPATDLGDAWIAPPEGFVGSTHLVAELRLSDEKMADQQMIQIDWVSAIAAPAGTHGQFQEIAARPLILPPPTDREPEKASAGSSIPPPQAERPSEEITAGPWISPPPMRSPGKIAAEGQRRRDVFWQLVEAAAGSPISPPPVESHPEQIAVESPISPLPTQFQPQVIAAEPPISPPLTDRQLAEATAGPPISPSPTQFQPQVIAAEPPTSPPLTDRQLAEATAGPPISPSPTQFQPQVIAAEPPISPPLTDRQLGEAAAAPPISPPPKQFQPDEIAAEAPIPLLTDRQLAGAAAAPLISPSPVQLQPVQMAAESPISPPPTQRQPEEAAALPPISPSSMQFHPEEIAVESPISPQPTQRQLNEIKAGPPIAPPPSEAQPEEATARLPILPSPMQLQPVQIAAESPTPPPSAERQLDGITAAPPIAPPPAQRKLDQEEIAVLLKRGKDLIANGDLAAARLVLQRAANANDAEAALALGATYDPYVLRALKVYGFKADPVMARVWYEKARELGSAAAPRRLEMLTSGMR
jgi:hypothetical protein